MKTLRWGIVGTGGIANSMAGMIKLADAAEIAAVSSRRMETAQEFAKDHNVPNAFDSWQAMIDSDEVSAIYVATPTSVREENCIAAAKGGNHVRGEEICASSARFVNKAWAFLDKLFCRPSDSWDSVLSSASIGEK